MSQRRIVIEALNGRRPTPKQAADALAWVESMQAQIATLREENGALEEALSEIAGLPAGYVPDAIKRAKDALAGCRDEGEAGDE